MLVCTGPDLYFRFMKNINIARLEYLDCSLPIANPEDDGFLKAREVPNETAKRKQQELGGLTFPKTKSLHLKMDGWKTSVRLGWPMFRAMFVSGMVLEGCFGWFTPLVWELKVGFLKWCSPFAGIWVEGWRYLFFGRPDLELFLGSPSGQVSKNFKMFLALLCVLYFPVDSAIQFSSGVRRVFFLKP